MKNKIAKTAFKLSKTPIGDLIVGIAFSNFSKLLPVKKVKETDKAIAFWHPKPTYEKHILIVPKKRIKRITSIKESDSLDILECFEIAQEIIVELKWESEGYSVTVNGGKRQEVGQLHFHLHTGKVL